MRKLWLDTETTGLDSNENGVIQLACIDDKTGAKFSINIKPFKECVYTKKAEEIHGKSKKMISKYAPEEEAMISFVDYLEKVKGNGAQLQIAGYNSRFDMDFVVALFERNGYKFWDYFNYYDIDVFALVKILELTGELDGKVCKKLGAICNTMNVKLDNAHDALSDIKATRKLYKKIMKRYFR